MLDNAHGNVYFGVANGTACAMHSVAWDDPEDKEDAHNAIRTSTPGRPIVPIKWHGIDESSKIVLLSILSTYLYVSTIIQVR